MFITKEQVILQTITHTQFVAVHLFKYSKEQPISLTSECKYTILHTYF